MSSVEIKILGQQFFINPPDDRVETYKKIASEVNKMMAAEVGKSELRSDLKAAIKTAFILALENHSLRESLGQTGGKLDELNELLGNALQGDK